MGEDKPEITLLLPNGEKCSFTAEDPPGKKKAAWEKFWNSWGPSNKKNGAQKMEKKKKNKKKAFKSF